MRILALDHGARRMGVAISDEMGMMALPMEFIEAEPFPEFLVRLKQILADKEVEEIVIGLPRNMDGSYGPAALKVQAFVAALKLAVPTPIRTWDERLTTVQAHRMLGQAGVKARDRKEKVDRSAAAIILQAYLDSKSGL